MAGATRIGTAIIASVLFAAVARAEAPPAAAPTPAEDRGLGRPRFALAIGGFQRSDGDGGELSVLALSDARPPGLTEYGFGAAAGATSGSVYLEGEGVLILGWRSPRAPDLALLRLFFTAGAGPVMRWRDGAVGVQATVSAAFMLMPVILFARPRVFVGDAGPQLVLGFMVKVPVWGVD